MNYKTNNRNKSSGRGRESGGLSTAAPCNISLLKSNLAARAARGTYVDTEI